jgi:transcription elongation factor GreB
MGRYRPPRKQGSCYITPEGEKALRAEVYQLWKIERPEVTAVVHEAAKNGDRSENGDSLK